MKLLLFILIFSPFIGFTQNIQWETTLGGSDQDLAMSVIETSTGNFFVGGQSNSADGDVSQPYLSTDYWVTLLNSSGVLQWEKTFGGNGIDQLRDVIETSDGGFLLAGWSNSTDGDVSTNNGSHDCWIVKISSSGVLEWEKNYGGSAIDKAQAIIECSDGNYLFVAATASNNGDVTTNYGSSDVWVVKINTSGTLIWEKNYGGSAGDDVSDVKETIDSGFIISCSTSSADGDVSQNQGNSDLWLIKIDSVGVLEWEKTYGGSDDDYSTSVAITNDGGYVIAGPIGSNDGDVTGFQGGNNDSWVVKTDVVGNMQWQKSLGGTGDDELYSLDNRSDGGLVLGILSGSTDGDISSSIGAGDAWIVGMDVSNGTIQWEKNFGGTALDGSYVCVRTCSGGGYVFSTYTASTDVDVTGNQGLSDYWVVRINDPFAGLENISAESEKTLLKIVNVLGQEIEYNSNVPLIYIYSDGTIEKKYTVAE